MPFSRVPFSVPISAFSNVDQIRAATIFHELTHLYANTVDYGKDRKDCYYDARSLDPAVANVTYHLAADVDGSAVLSPSRST